MLATDQAKISHMEAGRNGVSGERVRRLASFYACDDEPLVEALVAIAGERRGQYWWDEYRGILAPGFLDIAELEYHAVSIRSIQTFVVPGIFQTEDYARSIFEGAVPALPSEQLEARLEHRMRRRGIFQREEPLPYESIIHESALRMRFGGRKIAKDQLEYLLEISEWPGVVIRVIPFTNEQYIDLTHSIVYAAGSVPQLDTVQIDSPFGGRYLDAAADLKRFRTLIDNTENVSMTPEESRQLIHHIAREL